MGAGDVLFCRQRGLVEQSKDIGEKFREYNFCVVCDRKSWYNIKNEIHKAELILAMATKKTSSSSSRKRTTKSSTRPAGKTSKKTQEQERHQRQLWAILLFALGILLLALLLIEGQSIWKFIHDLLFGLFGATAYALPPVLVYIAVMGSLDRPIGSMQNKLWQTGVLIALICAAVQIFAVGQIGAEGEGFADSVLRLFDDGVHLKGGGLVGGILAWPMISACGKTGAGIIVCILIFVFTMILTGTTLIGLFRNMAKPVKKIEQSYSEHVMLARQEEERRQRFNIDVSLGPDPEELPPHPVSSPKPSAAAEKTEKEEKPDKLSRRERERLAEEARAAAEREAAEAFSRKVAKVEEALRAVPEPAADAMRDLSSGENHLLDESALQQTPDFQPVVPDLEPAAPPADLDQPLEAGKPAAESNQVDALIQKAVTAPRESSAEAFAVAEEPEQKMLYNYPPLSLLRAPAAASNTDVSGELKANAERLVNTLKSFGVETRIVDISRGPAVTRYELQPSAGVKISKITNLADDIALNLAAAGVRIEAPIPNKAAVGIEVPNKQTDVVTLREILDSREFENAPSKLTFGLGRDIAGKITVADIGKMPHVLIAGATGAGKSVCINSIIISLLYKASPDEVRLLMVDPKVVELGIYNGIPHLLVPVVTDPRKAAGALGWAVTEMLNRYKAFADNGVRDLKGYNALAKETDGLNPMPEIVIIIDELADLMMAAPNEVEDAICRLAQMARAAGMHLVIATQRPSVDVITGVIKANIPSRIAFAVSSQVDSRTILDGGGAEKMLGRGDMLFYPVGTPKPIRVQGCFVTDKEVEQVVNFVKKKGDTDYDDDIMQEIEKQAAAEKGSKKSGDGGGFEEQDDMLPQAIECVVEAGQASTSYLQRRLKLGYARAARIMDEMEQRGIIGPNEGSKPRQVLLTRQQWIEMKMHADSQEG